MKIAVLGGLGLQGRAAHRRSRRQAVSRRWSASTPPRMARPGLPAWPIFPACASSCRKGAIASGAGRCAADADAVIDLLPQPLMREAVQAAIATRTPLVTTNYGKAIADLAPAAERPACRS